MLPGDFRRKDCISKSNRQLLFVEYNEWINVREEEKMEGGRGESFPD